MQVVYKYDIDFDNETIQLQMPKGARILSLQTQGDIPRLWALVDPAEEEEARLFRIHGTGHPFDSVYSNYIGTFQCYEGNLVFHLFEI